MNAGGHEPPSRDLARFAAGLRLADVPAAVRERAKLHILDGLGLGLASGSFEFGRRAVEGGVALAGAGEGGACTVLGRPERLPSRDAALVNGILIHGLDFDDTHLESIVHPTCTSLPCVLSLAESLDASGEDLLAAYLAGAETAIRVGGAVRGGFHEVGFHATGLVSHFAAAIAASRLLGLDEEQIVSAQGIAGSTAAGIQVFLEEGAWTKRFHPGWGAVAGISAAQLARRGFRGPSRPYEGKFGLFETHLRGGVEAADPDELVADLGRVWRFGETALKPYPVCHFIHGCADAAIELHREIGGAEIAAVDAYLAQPTLHIVAEPAAAKERPTSDYEAKFSAQYVVARCLLDGRIGLPDLEPEAPGRSSRRRAHEAGALPPGSRHGLSEVLLRRCLGDPGRRPHPGTPRPGQQRRRRTSHDPRRRVEQVHGLGRNDGFGIPGRADPGCGPRPGGAAGIRAAEAARQPRWVRAGSSL